MGKHTTLCLFVGMVFTWPLLRTSATGTLLLGALPHLPWALDCYYLFIVLGFLFALLGSNAAPAVQRLLSSTRTVLTVAALAFVGNAVVALSLGLVEPHPLVLAFGTLGFALAIPLLLLAWASAAVRLMRVSYRRCSLCLCGSFAVSFITGMVQYLPYPAALVLPLLCPLVSGLLYARLNTVIASEPPGALTEAAADTPDTSPADDAPASPRLRPVLTQLPWGALALFIVTMPLGCLLVGIFRSGSIMRLEAELDITRDLVTALLAALILLLLTRLGRGPRTFRAIWVVIFAILCFGPLLIMVSHHTPLAVFGIAVSSASRACLSFLLFFYLASIATERQLPPIPVFAAVFLSSNALSDMLSFALVPAISSAISTDYASLLQPAAFGVSAVTFALFVGFSGKMALGSPYAEGRDDAEAPSDHHSDTDAALRDLLAEAGITERERDVLRLISEGNSYKATAQQLSITEGTVQSHIKRIYAKLNVHSRQELINLLRFP